MRTFAGREILAQSVWTQGPVLLQALGMLATLDLRALGHNSAPYIHMVTEALKLAFADRERFYGDPEHVRVPVAELLSPPPMRENERRFYAQTARSQRRRRRAIRSDTGWTSSWPPRPRAPPRPTHPRPWPMAPPTSPPAIATAT